MKRGRRYEAMYNLEMVGYTSGPGTQTFPPGFRFLFPASTGGYGTGSFVGTPSPWSPWDGAGH